MGTVPVPYILINFFLRNLCTPISAADPKMFISDLAKVSFGSGFKIWIRVWFRIWIRKLQK